MTPTPKYEFELWIDGVQVGDLTGLLQNRSYRLRRNASEELKFTIDLTAFEAYCARMGVDPSQIFEPYVTDIRVKRKGEYFFGVQLIDSPFTLDVNSSSMQCTATGFLDLYKDRYVTKNYDGYERTEIARDLLATTQAGDITNDFGTVDGPSQYDTGITDTERDYRDQNVRDAIVNLTSLSDGNFDFRFNYDRSFETFAQIGESQPDKKFTYPYNISSMTADKTALGLYNYVIGLGSGFGEETLRTETADYISRLRYKTRQTIASFNSVVIQQTLDENSYAYLQRVKNILLLPKLRVSGALADLDVIGIGDRIPVEVQGHPALPLDGTYRIEQLEVTLDENDAEDIAITVDDFGL